MKNPYLKKKKKNPPPAVTTNKKASHQHQATSLDATRTTSRLATDPLLNTTTAGAVTFSQAFSNLEETPHYQQEIRDLSSNGTPHTSGAARDPFSEAEKAEQRALDRQEAQIAAAAAVAAAAVGPTAGDRDHHVLLQQPHVLYVSTTQRGNGVLKYIRNVPFTFGKMVPDYMMSSTSCALFLSIKYHQLYPEYIHKRLGALKTDFKLRVLLVLVDVEDNANVILQLNKLAVTNQLTLILAWTEQEAARYLETFKALDGKDASSIRKRESNNFQDQIVDFFTACKPVNKTDSLQLLNHFGTVSAVLAASQDELALCEGLGPIKVQKLVDAFHKPFSKKNSKKRKMASEEKEAAKDDSPLEKKAGVDPSTTNQDTKDENETGTSDTKQAKGVEASEQADRSEQKGVEIDI